MTAHLKVSIIIPSHNKGKYLLAALDSALSQTWQNIEVIVVDDNSGDGSRDILSSIENDKLKTYFVCLNNASAARNVGLENATGDFVQFLDADDVIAKEKIALQLNDMKFKMDVVGVCNTKSFFENLDNGAELDTAFLEDAADPTTFLVKLYKSPDSGMVQPNAWLTPRAILDKAGPWNESLTVDDDGEYFCRVVLNAEAIVHTNVVLNYYRKFRDSSGRLSGQKTQTAFRSMMEAALLKKDQFRKFGLLKTSAAKSAINTLFASVMVSSYPVYADISAEAARHIDWEHPTAIPKVGGRVVETVKKVFGWKAAVRFKNVVNRMRNSSHNIEKLSFF